MAPPVLDLSTLPVPTPVLDTTDLSAIVNLPSLPDLPGEATARAELYLETRSPHWDTLTDRHRYRAWVQDATALAAHGVRPGPSHHQVGDRLVPAWTGGFADVTTATPPASLPSDPSVIFGCAVDPAEQAELRDFPSGYDWRALTHQSAGMACHHPRFVGMPLSIRPERLGDLYRMTAFPDFHGHDCIGLSQLLLSELVDYHTLLTTLGLSAQRTWSHLQEAVYPLDADCASVVSDTPVPTEDQLCPRPAAPADLATTLAWFAQHTTSPWGVYVFGPNCD